MKFNELNLDPLVLEGIDAMGFETATPIQEKVIPEILNGRDIIAAAQTGTGKTAAFLLPIIHKILQDKGKKHMKALVIVPTRELAIQIDQQMQGLGYFSGVQSIATYGGTDGTSFSQEKQAMTEGIDIVIGTPGRLISHLSMGYVKVDDLKYLVLDEADRMLDMGFIDDIMRITAKLPEKRQNLLFSATMPPKIRELAKKILHDPLVISTEISKPPEAILQAAYLTYDNQKTPLILNLIKDKPECKSILIFSSTKKKVFEIKTALKGKGFTVESISSDLEQSEREQVLLRFRSKETRVLVATDVLSRGIDVKDINLVINYDVPHDAEDYVHRVGRTARADTTGIALTMINQDDMYKFRSIEKLIEKIILKIPLPPEFGKSLQWNPDAKERRPGRAHHGKAGRKPNKGFRRKPKK